MTNKNDLITQINTLEQKIAANNNQIKTDKNLIKVQLTNPILVPLLIVGSVAIGFLIVRKKRHKHLFAYLTSLSLAASSIYRNIQFVRRAINNLNSPKTIPGNPRSLQHPRE